MSSKPTNNNNDGRVSSIKVKPLTRNSNRVRANSSNNTNNNNNSKTNNIARTSSNASVENPNTNNNNILTNNINFDHSSSNSNLTSSIHNDDLSEIEVLRKELENVKGQLTNSETEKETYIFQIGELKKKSKRDLERLEIELHERKEKQQYMEEKLARVELIEEGIIKLYLEMKDRSHEVVLGTDEEIKEIELKEKEELRRENPLVVLDRLKANLRTLLVFKDDYENELKDQIRRRKTEAEYKVVELKAKIEQIEKEKEELQETAKKAIQLKDETLRFQKLSSEKYAEDINKLKQENSMLAGEILKKEGDIDKLHEMLDRRDAILRHREVQMMEKTQLESKIKNDEKKHHFDINREKSEKFKLMKKYESDLSYYKKLENEKKELEDQIGLLKAQVHSFKHNASRQRVQELEQENERLKQKVSTTTGDLSKSNTELKSLRIQVDNLMKSQIEMKQQYLKIFNAHTEEKKKRKEQEKEAIRQQIEKHFHESSERNPQLASYYKKKLKEKEKEVEDLHKRVKRLILLKHQDTQVEKQHEVTKNKLIGEIAMLKNQVSRVIPEFEQSSVPDGELLRRNTELEQKLRDYENVVSLTVSQSSALAHNSDLDSSLEETTLDRGTNSSFGNSFNSTYSAPKTTGFKPTRPQSAANYKKPPNSPNNNNRPFSAGPIRPSSAKKMKIGSSRSTIKIGTLTGSKDI